VTLSGVTAEDYDRAPSELPSLHFSFEPPVTRGAVLRQLGTPAAWSATASPADALASLVGAAAEAARRTALSEQPQPSAQPTLRKPRGKGGRRRR
jgi:hypothetical protein